ncbi:tetratricopeptide repeat protein [Sulfitobacter sp. MF3-043]|uniref:tetratricopeptide repeat protein n=1 Tax=Sulfitobacter sediminivivens TaxID=3252902 RepID=UPI0036DE687C
MTQISFLRAARFVITLCVAMTLLSACDSAEERAEAHFQSGLALLAEGDVDRALIELRNVFKLNGQHKEARLTYARIERERGNISGSYGQYLRLIEQDPDNLEGRRALAEMAIETGNWEEVGRHGAAAAALSPDDLGIQSINNTFAYSQATQNGDADGIDYTVHLARTLVEADPSLMTARRVVIDNLVRNQDWYDVLAETGTALTLDPDMGSLYTIRLSALQALEKSAEIAELLKRMANQFPKDEGIKQMLIQHYIDHQNLDVAEQFLRADMDPMSDDHLAVQRLIAFLDQFREPQAAIAEMNRIIALDGPNKARFKAMRAVLKFRTGDTQTAITEMEALLDSADRSNQTREIEVEFARLLFQAKNPVDARELIEKVLAEDPTQVEALKFKAAWLIEEDETGEAIVQLREALGQSPRDAQLMTLMARAHERNGDRALMGKMLALAVESSLNAPQESLRYAQYLAAENDLTIAESVLLNALRRSPTHSELLAVLGHLYLEMEDWSRLETVVRIMDDLGDIRTKGMSAQLKVTMLAAQQRTGDLTAFLSDLTNDPDFGLSAEIALIRSKQAQGDTTGAFARLDQLLKDNPGSLPLRFMKAYGLVSDGKFDAAEVVYRAIVKDHPNTVGVWIALHALQMVRGDLPKAQAVLDDALAALPDDPNLLMQQAAAHERSRQMDKAIEVYEKLYALNSRSQVVANNLSSLLTTHRTDDESLQRAFTLARRLRGTRVPAFQDTYGWIAYRMGNYEEALHYLEPAAVELPNEPLVLYHLAQTYAALDREDDALRTYQAAFAVMEDLETPPSFTPTLEAEIARLTAELAAGQ